MKRSVFLLLLLLTYAQAFGEAFKGQDLGEFVWGVLLLLVGAPIGIGLGMYVLLRSSDEDYTASKGLMVFFSCVAWWCALFMLAGNPQDSANILLLLCASMGAAAGAYYMSREAKANP